MSLFLNWQQKQKIWPILVPHIAKTQQTRFMVRLRVTVTVWGLTLNLKWSKDFQLMHVLVCIIGDLNIFIERQKEMCICEMISTDSIREDLWLTALLKNYRLGNEAYMTWNSSERFSEKGCPTVPYTFIFRGTLTHTCVILFKNQVG